MIKTPNFQKLKVFAQREARKCDKLDRLFCLDLKLSSSNQISESIFIIVQADKLHKLGLLSTPTPGGTER